MSRTAGGRWGLAWGTDMVVGSSSGSPCTRLPGAFWGYSFAGWVYVQLALLTCRQVVVPPPCNFPFYHHLRLVSYLTPSFLARIARPGNSSPCPPQPYPSTHRAFNRGEGKAETEYNRLAIRERSKFEKEVNMMQQRSNYGQVRGVVPNLVGLASRSSAFWAGTTMKPRGRTRR